MRRITTVVISQKNREENRLEKKRVCANCGNYYYEEYRYCPFCGAPLGEPEYINDYFQEIYGPPPGEEIELIEDDFQVLYGPPPGEDMNVNDLLK